MAQLLETNLLISQLAYHLQIENFQMPAIYFQSKILAKTISHGHCIFFYITLALALNLEKKQFFLCKYNAAHDRPGKPTMPM